MSTFSDFFDKAFFAGSLPDFAQLGERLFICDGVNPNIVLDGRPENTRIMGVFPQSRVPEITLTAGTNLIDEELYAWAIERVIKIGDFVVRSDLIINSLKITGGDTSVEVVLVDYEYPPSTTPAGGFAVFYRIFRSQAINKDLLFLVSEIDQTTLEALPAGPDPDTFLFKDTVVDAGLDQSFERDVAFTFQQPRKFVFPTKFIRAFRGRLITGGTLPYRVGTITVDGASKDTAELQSPGKVRDTDIGANINLDGETFLRTITAVDTATDEWTVTPDFTDAHTTEKYSMFRDFDTIFTTNVLPDDIESFLEATEVFSNTGGGNVLTGIGVSGRFCYLFRRNSVELLEQAGENFAIIPLLQGVGCVSHATIADRRTDSFLYWYAGENGFWEFNGTSRRMISEPIREIIDNEVDHSLNEFTHGVFDPNTGQYHNWLFEKGEFERLGVRVPTLMLTYDSRREIWYKSRLGASMSKLWKDETGRFVPVIGIAGAVAQLEINTFDGFDVTATLEAGDVYATNFFVDADASFLVPGSGLSGTPLYIIRKDPTTNVITDEEMYIIKENTDTRITIYGTFAFDLADGDIYHVGAIEHDVVFPDMEFHPGHDIVKKAWNLMVIHDQDDQANDLEVSLSGVRTTEDAVSTTQVANLNGFDETFVQGHKLGNRSRAFRPRLFGVNTRPVKIISIQLDTVDAAKKKR